MSALIDTSIWSLALRRPSDQLNPAERRLTSELAALIGERRAVLLGLVRQEALSGIRLPQRFERLRTALRSFPDQPVTTADHVRAAEHFNICQAHGIQGSAIDFLICAVAERLGASIFTTDGDFPLYARHLPITLHQPRGSHT